MTIYTERLLLRAWEKNDLTDLIQLNADPEVMRFFPSVLTKEESEKLLDKMLRHFENFGFGIWRMEEKNTKEFIGFTGLHQVGEDMDFAPAVEIAWRLKKEYWGLAYATEAALFSVGYAFSELGLDQLVSYTTKTNLRSEKLMQRIGMRKMGEFTHPRLSPGHPLAPHVLYKIEKAASSR